MSSTPALEEPDSNDTSNKPPEPYFELVRKPPKTLDAVEEGSQQGDSEDDESSVTEDRESLRSGDEQEPEDDGHLPRVSASPLTPTDPRTGTHTDGWDQPSREGRAKPRIPDGQDKYAFSSYRKLDEVADVVSDNQCVRRALFLHQDFEAKQATAAEAANVLQAEEERLRQFKKNNDTTLIEYQQSEVEKAWKTLMELEKIRDLAELKLHKQIARATDAERRAMMAEQQTSFLAGRRQQDEVSRARRHIRNEFTKDKADVARIAAVEAEKERKAQEADKHQKLRKKSLRKQQIINNQREKDAQEITDTRYKERADRYLQLKNSTTKINSVIQASNEKRAKKEARALNERDRRKDALLREGLNPYEVFRQEEVDKTLKKMESDARKLRELGEKRMKEIIARDEEMIKKQQRQNEAQMIENEAYQKQLGGHVQYEKVKNYIKKVTVNHTELVDATGSAIRIDPSKITVFGSQNLDMLMPKEIALMESKVKRKLLKVKKFNDTLPKVDNNDFPDLEEATTEDTNGTKDGKIWEMKLSKFEEDMMAQARIRQKEGICQPQRCWSKEFQGDAFLCKPAVIAFNDFEVDQKYKQVIEITNVSLTFNQFKLLPLDESITDFFEIVSVPPGRMSAGISCNITISFFPKVYKDIDSVFPILAKTGKLEFPLRCATKKTVLTITPQDAEARPLVDFGHVLAGEKNTVVLSIKNQGALRAAFTLESWEPDKENPFMDMIAIKRPTEIAALDTTKISFCFTPTELGAYETMLRFHVDNGGKGDSNFERIYEVVVKGSCVEVPIYVEKAEYDMQTIIQGHTYREAITFCNRQSVAMKIQIEEPVVSPELNLNPLVAFIQGNGQQAVQVKFTPRRDFLDTHPEYRVDQNGGFKIPIKLVGADQVLPVWTALVGTLSNNTVVFDPPLGVSFGTCFVGSSTAQRFTITNKSSLTQQFAFYRLPSCIKVESIPKDLEDEEREYTEEDNIISACNDGGGSGQLGTLLPLESITVNLIYSPESATSFEHELMFKTHTNTVAREFIILVRGQGKAPILQFSATQLELAAIPADISTLRESIEVVNVSSHSARFCIVVPPEELARLYVCPVCLTLKPDERARVQVEFRPTSEYASLLDVEEYGGVEEGREGECDEVEEEKKAAEGEEKEDGGSEEKTEDDDSRKERKQAEAKANYRKKMLRVITKNGGRRWEKKDEGLVSALWKLQVNTKIASSTTSSASPVKRSPNSNPGGVDDAVSYLSVRTAVVTPVLVCQPKNLDFGEITALQRSLLHVTLRNTMGKNGPHQRVWTDPLPENACFTMINAPRTVVPGKPFQISVAFRPLEAQIYKSMLRIHTERTRVEVILTGKGVCPVLALDPPSGCLHMGGVVDNTSSNVSKVIFLENTSKYALSFQLQRRLQSSTNCLGIPPFVLTPSSGVIAGKATDEDSPVKVPITVTFRPHRPFEIFREKIYVSVANQTKESFLYVYGHAFRYSMYLIYFDEFGPFDDINTLGPFQDELSVGMATSNPKLLYYEEKATAEYCRAQRTSFNLTFDPETNEEVKLIIGQCAPQGYHGSLGSVPAQPAGNFEVQIPPEKQQLFSVDQPKGTVGPAQSTVLKFKYHKAADSNALMFGDVELTPLAGVGQWIHCSVKIILSGGFSPPGEPATQEYPVDLKAYLQQI